MKNKNAAALVILLSCAFSVSAQERPYYFRGDIGVSAPTKVDLSNSPNLRGLSLLWQEGGAETNAKRFQLDAGPLISGAVGWRVAPGWRLEGALAYRQHDMKETSRVSGNPFLEYHYAKTDSWNAMLNGYRDFDMGWALKPYLGAGIGVARNNFKSHITQRLTPPASFTSRSLQPRSETDYAWSMAAGFQWKLSAVTLDLGYRYSDLGKMQSNGLVPILGGGTTVQTIQLTGHMRAHEFTVGLLF